MNMYMRLLVVLLVLAGGFKTYAQQDLMVSQQVFSRMNINPAGTGNTERFDVFLLGRLQWLGVDNTPKTGLLNFVYYNEPLRSSIGLTANYDDIGIGNSQTNVQAVYAYHLDLNENYILSMGLSGGVDIGSFDPYENTLRDEEPDFSSYVSDATTEVNPDVNVGLELTSKNWMVGLSATHVLKSKPTTFRRGRHIYAYTRCLVPLGESFDLAPMLSYIHQNQVNEGEIGAMLFVQRKFWGGATWKPDFRNVGDMSLLAVDLGLEVKNYRVGYAYTFNVGTCNNLPSNTHELLLSVHF